MFQDIGKIHTEFWELILKNPTPIPRNILKHSKKKNLVKISILFQPSKTKCKVKVNVKSLFTIMFRFKFDKITSKIKRIFAFALDFTLNVLNFFGSVQIRS